MSDVEKKRQILTYTTFMRKQHLKMLVLVKWAESSNDIQMCQVRKEKQRTLTLAREKRVILTPLSHLEHHGLFSQPKQDIPRYSGLPT